MKFTKLSLVAALAVSSAFAGGDIAPVEPEVAPVVETSATTISGKLTGYYITDDSLEDADPSSDMFGDQAQLAFGATLDVSHKFTDWLTANFTVLGFLNTMNHDSWGYFEGGEDADKYGAFFNVANLTATFGDTTLVAGRQLMGTPMLQGYDWLLAPESFEAYTVVNSSIENVTLVGSYVTEYRGINSGDFGSSLNGDNYAFGAAYDDKTISGSVWYYNVDHAKYSQVYADLGYDFGSFKVAGQYVDTSNDMVGHEDGTAFGIMASTSVAGFDLSAAYNNLDGRTGFVGWNGLYTNQWNTTVATEVDSLIGGDSIDAWKVAASTTVMGIAAEVSYSDFDNDSYEFDVILGYDVTDAIDVGVVYTKTKSTVWTELIDQNDVPYAVNQLEIYANYKF